MKAAVFHGRKDIRIDEVPAPALRPGSVAIDVAWCGICGTDLHEYLEGPIFIPPAGHPHPLTHETEPVTMGHEFSGTITALGDGVNDLRVGENVVVEPYFVRIAAGAGVLVLAMMWLAEFPLDRTTADGKPSGSSNPITDYHFIYGVGLVVLALTYAGHTWGLGRRWAQLSFVQKNRWLI